MAILTAGSVSLPDPKSIEWTISDMDSENGTGRNQLGELFRDRIAVKRKLSVEWAPLSNAEMSRLLNAVSGVFFTLTYPDAQTGAMRTMTAYVSDRTAPVLRYYGASKYMWNGVSMSFVEK